ncbi:putative exonuclease GOR, partial [Centruroides sculpturatus]|uniref:putative exonuclease GOR n=1 Tax=Centruroides sculpturatus TaxID=218467 RepID=UPI000C6EBC92
MNVPLEILRMATSSNFECRIYRCVSKTKYNEGYLDQLYRFLESIMLKPRHLKDYGFPLRSSTTGQTYYNVSRLESCTEDENKRLCIRCHAYFNIWMDDPDDICVYHPKKLITAHAENNHKIYACCKKEEASMGCFFNNYHISTSKCRPSDVFFSTEECDFIEKNIVVFDTEMCYTKFGMEINKIILLSFDGSLIYETNVLPQSPVLGHKKKCSEMMGKLLVPFTQMRRSLLSFINKDTIIIGHGLENDLKALRLIHEKIVDTSIIFPDRRGFPYRPSLKSWNIW